MGINWRSRRELDRPAQWKRAVAGLAVAAVGAIPLAGCARAHAKTVPETPALEVPAPPPQDIQPLLAGTPPPPIPLVEEPARPAPVTGRGARPPAAPRPDATRAEPARPEPPPAETPRPEEPPRAATLQTAPPGTESEMERGIRQILGRATADLNRIDYRTLGADARAQYDTAKRFITQAQDSVRAKNLVFAKSLADKAAALAAQLSGQ